MGLVEDEERAGREVPQPVLEADEVVVVAEQGVRDDEVAVGLPWVDAEATLASASVDVCLVEHDEAEAEALEQLVPPLEHHGGRAGHDDAVDPLPQEESWSTSPASIVFPSPTSSAMNRFTRGSARAFRSGSS